MAGNQKQTRRKDSKGRVLNAGEYEKPNGGYQYKWTSNGKRKCVGATTLTELRKLEEQIRFNLVNGIDLDRSNVTLNALFEQHMELKYNSLKPSTHRNYIVMWNSNIRESIGNLKIADIRPLHIKQLYSELQKRGMKKSSIKLLHHLIFSSLEIAVENDFIYKNPSKNALKDIANDACEKVPLTEKQIESLLEFCNNSIYNEHIPFLVIALGTGMRCSELCGLTWEDVDMKNRSIHIDHQLIYKNIDGNGCKFFISTPKTTAGARVIPMTDFVYHAFIELKKLNLLLGRRSESEIDGYSNFCFVTKNNTPFATNAINAFLLHIEKAYNKTYPDHTIPHLSAHILRHSACTLYATNKMDLKVLQSIMGHADASITMNVYNHNSAERTKEEMQRFDKVINF